jgi:hypothetical protein
MTVATALRETERGSDKIVESELHRLKSELLLMRDPPQEAEARLGAHCLTEQGAAEGKLRQRPAKADDIAAISIHRPSGFGQARSASPPPAPSCANRSPRCRVFLR